MRIRPFRKGDGKTFLGLVRALARYEKLRPPSPSASRRLLRDAGRRFQVLFCEVEGKVVGYAAYFHAYSSFLARPTLYLEDIFILPEARRRGAGKKFMEALRRKARRERCGRMEWTVLDWNTPAIRFYKKVGARPLAGWTLYRVTL